MKRKICILGSTGSIGTQALQVIEEHSDLFEAYVLTAGNNADLLIEQARKFLPCAVVIADESKYAYVSEALSGLPIQVYAGSEALCQVVAMEPVDMVLTALVGFSGLRPTISAIKARKPIALANKETLVVAGELITALCKEYNVPMLPVDSEHSAIFQSLMGEESPIEKLILTASGGPFRKFSLDEMKNVTAAQALKHPNWDMGAKITIDSATLVNKGFEVIEARWLFGVEAERISVILHPEAIIHSLVEFEDGALKAQLGTPDMHMPISLALMFPERAVRPSEQFSFTDHPTLTFREVDRVKYPALDIAYDCLRRKGTAACTMNASNEVAVAAFLSKKCSYNDIVRTIEHSLAKATFVANPTLDDYAASNAESRALAAEFLKL